MSYGERSKKFDWFDKSNENKKTKKDTAKTTWKFLKIFIYITLFVFSMVGCVQSFVIKTENFNGQGFEIYRSEKDISPHVTEFTFKKIDASKLTGSSSVGSAKDLYSVSVNPKTNIYVNPEQRDKDDKLVLEQIHNSVKEQNKKNDLKMSDARKGVNEGIHFQSEIPGIETSPNIVHQFKGQKKYSVLSSKAQLGKENYNLGGDTSLINNIKLWIPKKDDKNDKNKVTGFESATFDWYEYNKNEGKPGSKTDPNKPEVNSNPKNLYTAAIFNEIFNENNKLYKDFLSKDPKSVSDKFNEQQNFNNLQRLAYVGVLSYLGVNDAADKDNKEHQFKFFDGSMPSLFFGETGYRPTLTWGDAWSLGPFYGLFVYPIGKLFAILVGSMPLIQGWEVLFSIIIIVVLSRLLTFLLSFKSTMQQTKMQELQAKKAIIDAKYAPYKGNKQMENRKRQETAELYKKAGINPLGALGTVFVTMPIFLTLLRVISSLQQIKSTIWLGINFSATSYQELFNGNFQYLPLLIIAALTQLLAQLYPRLLTRKRDSHQINVYQKAAMKKNNKTQNIMMGVMVFMALIFSAGIQIYWIIGGVWRIFEVYLTHKIIHRKRKPKNKNTLLVRA